MSTPYQPGVFWGSDLSYLYKLKGVIKSVGFY